MKNKKLFLANLIYESKIISNDDKIKMLKQLNEIGLADFEKVATAVGLGVGAATGYKWIVNQLRQAHLNAVAMMAEGKNKCKEIHQGKDKESEFKNCLVQVNVKAIDLQIEKNKKLLEECLSKPNSDMLKCKETILPIIEKLEIDKKKSKSIWKLAIPRDYKF